MKKVFLSLAVIAALTVVSCKDKAAETETPAVDTTAVEAPAVDTTAVVADTTAVAPAAPAETPAAPAEEVKK